MPPIIGKNQPWSSMPSATKQQENFALTSGIQDQLEKQVPMHQPASTPVVPPSNRLEYHHIPLRKESDPEIEELTKAVDEKTLAIEEAEKPKEKAKESPTIIDPISLYNHTVETMNPHGGQDDDTEA